MFEKMRAKWALKRRVDDLEETYETLDKIVARGLRKAEENHDLLQLEVQRLRGRVTGKIRNLEPDIEPQSDSYDEIDRQIREGTFEG